ncbi:MAG TPA: ComEC/Rec2 family competence protein, partial [Chitinophagaceae bacterium]|nr:ComEC/Rec2 family competence protein [Chitinophagaceae bacterium]
MVSRAAYFWKQTPFTRLLPSLIAGIIIQWYLQLPVSYWWILLVSAICFKLIFLKTSFFQRYRFAWLNGIAMAILLMSTGGLLAWFDDIRNDRNWFGHSYVADDTVIVTLNEPLVERARSLKANAKLDYIINSGRLKEVRGTIILYFKKDSTAPGIDYGSRIIFRKTLQEIRNSGNPGGFDYKRFALFQGITHQLNLKAGEFAILPGKKTNRVQSMLYRARDKILAILRTNIRSEKECGLAEALLVGYKNDLDKSLVQSYSNTGVVHIIAISGMHLALIYWLVNLLLKPVGKNKRWRWIKPVIAILVLWSFSLLTGASASVLRAAVMFTFIVCAESFSRKTNIYNTLAASAFFLLCVNPYWLWDVGFQLSYAAVLSIVIFQRPVYNIFYCKNKLLDQVWKLNAVTLAAQLLTTPLSIFHFHQFPCYFILTNLVAVPLSSIIVLGEILLCAVSFASFLPGMIGSVLSWLISLMNTYVGKIESLPGSLWDGFQINIVQAILLFVVIAGASFWLLRKYRWGLIISLGAMLYFLAIRAGSFVSAEQQQKIIVYNVPQRRAIDFINGRDCFFYGDITDEFVQNFHLKPSRILSRVSSKDSLPRLSMDGRCFIFGNKKILLADTAFSFLIPAEKYGIDLLVVSGNPKLYFSKLALAFTIKQVVFDG